MGSGRFTDRLHEGKRQDCGSALERIRSTSAAHRALKTDGETVAPEMLRAQTIKRLSCKK
ncbi:MAG: hypothetical protein LBO67_08085 [Spirochaetaceae bacterium]|jgi:hypothetical protein|nr:hypothetical protein [Spirochaetaceae bacterium]